MATVSAGSCRRTRSESKRQPKRARMLPLRFRTIRVPIWPLISALPIRSLAYLALGMCSNEPSVVAVESSCRNGLLSRRLCRGTLGSADVRPPSPSRSP